MPTSADDLIRQYITLGPEATGPVDARIVDVGIHVWALIGHLRANDEDPHLTAADYGLPLEAVTAARAYYHRHQAVIDARLTLQAAFFAVGA